MLNKFFDWFTHLLMLWVLLAVAVGFFWPKVLLVFKDYTEWLFSFTMFGIGAVLSLKDFAWVFKKPQAILLGTLAQFGIMPVLGFGVVKLLRLPPELGLGVILAGAVLGAMASNVISYLAKADVAYSIALTTTATFLSPLLTYRDKIFTHVFKYY